MITRRRILHWLGAVPVTLAASRTAFAAEPLRVGMSAAFTGPAQSLGTGMRSGVLAAFAEQNASGGVGGRPLELVALDDGYEPSRTAPNMRKLVDEHDVIAVLGNVGTPTAAVAVPIANEKKVPFWGAFTGAGLLRKTPPDRYVVNYRASYAQEMDQLITRLLRETDVKPEEIAFFTQNDAYGDAGHSGAMKALKSLGFERAERLTHARYTRNTDDVEYGVSQLIDPRNRPKIVFMVGTADPCAKMVRLAKERGLAAAFVGVSFIGANPLLERLGPDLAENVAVSQVVPHPELSSLPAAERFRSVVPDVAQRGFVSFEGYLAARFFIEALERADLSNPRESVLDVVESGQEFDLGLEQPRRLSKDQHQYEQSVWPTVIRSGQIEVLDDWSLLMRKVSR